MKLSDHIVKRLNELGWEVFETPKRNMHYLNAGWRSAGTCCWYERIRRTVNGVMEEGELTSQFTMAQVVKAKTWDIHWYEPDFGYVLDLKWEEVK